MSAPSLLSGRPQAEFMEDGFRLLTRDLVVDFGVLVQELEDWETESQRSGVDWRISTSGYNTSVIRVVAGLVYDGASIPTFISLALGGKELWEIAGVVHDALYQWQAPRAAADHVFWLIASSGLLRVGAVQSWLGWAGLRVFGWAAYRSHRIGGETQKAVVAVATKMLDARP